MSNSTEKEKIISAWITEESHKLKITEYMEKEVNKKNLCSVQNKEVKALP